MKSPSKTCKKWLLSLPHLSAVSSNVSNYSSFHIIGIINNYVHWSHWNIIVDRNSNRSYKLQLSYIFQYDYTIYISGPKSTQFLFTISTLFFTFCVNSGNISRKTFSAISRVLSLFGVNFQACVPYVMTSISILLHTWIFLRLQFLSFFTSTVLCSPSDLLNNPFKITWKLLKVHTGEANLRYKRNNWFH